MQQTWLRWSSACCALAFFAACSSSPDKPKPAPLPAVSGEMVVKKVWTNAIGPVTTPLRASVHAGRVAVASTQGQVVLLDAATGKDIWRVKLSDAIQAGVGGDGQRFAVVTGRNELVTIEDGKVIWRYALTALTLTPPLVAGGRVFVLNADRSVTALDGATGQKLWMQQRAGEPLVLNQAGLLMPFGDTLLVGWGGRLAALNPMTGSVRWETLLANSRGTNEVERLVDLVAGVDRLGNTVCARAFQSTVACIDASRGSSLWTRSAQGHEGLAGDDQRVFGAESDSKVIAWQRENGQVAWTQTALRFRGLSAPLVLERSLVLGDDDGVLHFLARQDGKLLQRIGTDGSAIVGRPVLADETLVVVTRTGGVFGYRPE
ncbi:outer membrane protein assembly factor BamB [Limnohabitans sp. Jir72]|uniref:outer membrane protein assembly factor BamB n=1 Tax=Limnohabitans sp. Jir72 TaxID=1977909 RepID=UPI000D3CBC13|nr:outer membrane protein assembly factor BamB [Limnohabitans sp. Jir72]PUE30639.1 outer membrane protein assembly factor BamB [Limnohabitans sp. Jir72]